MPMLAAARSWGRGGGRGTDPAPRLVGRSCHAHVLCHEMHVRSESKSKAPGKALCFQVPTSKMLGATFGSSTRRRIAVRAVLFSPCFTFIRSCGPACTSNASSQRSPPSASACCFLMSCATTWHVMLAPSSTFPALATTPSIVACSFYFSLGRGAWRTWWGRLAACGVCASPCVELGIRG